MVSAKEQFVVNVGEYVKRIEVALLRLTNEEFCGTSAYDLFGCICDIKKAGAMISFDDIADALKLMERVLLSMQYNEIAIDMEMIDCFIEFGNCVSELMSSTFDDEAIVDEYCVGDMLVRSARR